MLTWPHQLTVRQVKIPKIRACTAQNISDEAFHRSSSKLELTCDQFGYFGKDYRI